METSHREQAKNLGKAIGEAVRTLIVVESDQSSVLHHVVNGGCYGKFKAAALECHPGFIEQRDDPTKRAVDVEACVRATAALRECFAKNPEWFKHYYLRRLDEGLDQDLNPSPEEVEMEDEARFRWWTGMRRS